MKIRHGYHPKNCAKFFVNGFGLDQLREGLLLKDSYTTVHHFLGAGKLPRKSDSHKIVRFKSQMIVIRMPLKQPSSDKVWSRQAKKLELAEKIRLTKCFLMTSSTWIINVYAHSHIRNLF